MLIPLTTVEYAQHLFQRYNDIPQLVLPLVLIRDAIALFGSHRAICGSVTLLAGKMTVVRNACPSAGCC
jgi:hypothetical protein